MPQAPTFYTWYRLMSSSATFRSAVARVEDMVSGRHAGRGEATAEQAIARVPSGGSNGRAHTTSDASSRRRPWRGPTRARTAPNALVATQGSNGSYEPAPRTRIVRLRNRPGVVYAQDRGGARSDSAGNVTPTCVEFVPATRGATVYDAVVALLVTCPRRPAMRRDEVTDGDDAGGRP